MSELQGLQARLEDIRRLDGEILAISADRSEDLRQLAESQGLDYRLVSDPELKVIDAYGLRHVGAGMGESSDIARPAVFVLDREGRIVWRDITDNWRVRVRPESILEQLAAIS